MNSCRIFHNIHSITYNYCILKHKRNRKFDFFSVRSIFISLMNTNSNIFTRGSATRENTTFGVHSVGWLVGCFGFNGPLRQYFSLYRAVSQREGERGERIDESKNVQTNPTRTYCKCNRPLPYCNPNCRTPRHWKFTQYHRTTRPPSCSFGEIKIDLTLKKSNIFYVITQQHTRAWTYDRNDNAPTKRLPEVSMHQRHTDHWNWHYAKQIAENRACKYVNLTRNKTADRCFCRIFMLRKSHTVEILNNWRTENNYAH